MSPTTRPVPRPSPEVPWWRNAVMYEVYLRSFADGDGDFRPKITVNGERPRKTTLLPLGRTWSKDSVIAGSFEAGDAYAIDFDWVAWKLQEKDDQERAAGAKARRDEQDWGRTRHD